jgi:hypothetical protein
MVSAGVRGSAAVEDIGGPDHHVHVQLVVLAAVQSSGRRRHRSRPGSSPPAAATPFAPAFFGRRRPRD